MTIAFDFDDTITAYPEFFTTIGKLLIKEGHTVYVLTGREKRQLFDEPLPTQKITMYDMWEKYGKDWYSDLLTWDLRTPEEDHMGLRGISNEEKVARFKMRICEDYKIDLFFDDRGEINYSLCQKNICTVHS